SSNNRKEAKHKLNNYIEQIIEETNLSEDFVERKLFELYANHFASQPTNEGFIKGKFSQIISTLSNS
ncbi:MAG: hypothetical protein WBG62_18360, partial [Cyclobacteriaceae bacterium]